MKRTLARSPVALRSLMTWYDLRDEVAAFLGERRRCFSPTRFQRAPTA